MSALIGVTTYREEAAWGVWRQRADVLQVEYADAVVRAGGVPVLLPPASADLDDARSVVDAIAGLVVAGGADVEPARYGEEPHERTAAWRPDRDAWELALLGAAEESGLPTLGVCRGMQLMAVAAGGRLHQHTPDVVGHEQHSPGGDAFGRFTVSTEPGSLIARIEGPLVEAHCHHHQSVATHPGFVASARAEDGTVEAIEQQADRFCLGVQWHPEMSRDQRLFDALVDATRSRVGLTAPPR
ncbi:MAG: gamma-glutamyl-gamma-aminobutyrate hydrolase family protein [Nocardioides sp.]